MQKKTYAVRYVAGQPVEQIFPPSAMLHLRKALLPKESVISNANNLKVLIWNIFKQQRSDWMSVLQGFGKDAHLMLLQEAQTTPELVHFATSNYLTADQVPAFVLPQHPSGVMTLASAYPVYCYPLREREPLLRLAKSALVTAYTLPTGAMLMVVNIHAINFSLGIDVYSKQLGPIGEQILHHKGPVIMAGDFNAWNRHRIHVLYRFMSEMAIKEVRFIHDHRRKMFGLPLDFVFYRDISVNNASVLVTQASDHNPLLVEFNTAS
ncbi:endonuclease/exonuclease/phosphatase family protein [Pantoea sp. Nvir]|uniref:endonuclease/exonuclease/phosphatase family protein n=1 Tax=Pantoea sp. Nvir TaxID=2576760 RepID=UPI00135A66E2|nr:endonuclease/exonuclease/phosphatase family protein [Pantoea sp. Nvir]MXP67036.1 endonuclease/exonuclease/phosphatase family protein [Pantoea sp. Nvir]CAJ0992736.1 hypothetical protein NVIRPANT_00764 [Pantoea sp. Nvir]